MSRGFYAVGAECSFTRYLAGEFDQVLGFEERFMADEAALALRAAMFEYGYVDQIPSNLLTLMVARILATLNRPDAAKAYIQTNLGAKDAESMYLALLDRPDFDIRSWQLLDSKILHSEAWDSLHQQAVWVLNLDSLCNDQSLCYELAFYNVLRELLEQLEAYGDRHDGQFFVALRGFMPLGRVLSAVDVKRYCDDVLARIRLLRGWSEEPVVGFLDLPVNF